MNKEEKALHTIAFNTQFIAGMNFGNELRTLSKTVQREKVLKEKNVDLMYLRGCIEDDQPVERYNEYIKDNTMIYCYRDIQDLTEEDYELFKEWLLEEIKGEDE